MTRIRHAVLTLAAATLAACGGSGGSSTGPRDPRTIDATPSLSFGPSMLTVNVGDEVTFAFGSVAHNVFFDAGVGAPADIAGNNANVSVRRTFTTAGSFHYTCHIHPGMAGTVVVH